jgi:glycosyltransferase involved in cell wall biosynthesis
MTAPISVLCLSHLRWSFAAQRPHQLLSRCARDRPTVFFEEPVFDTSAPILELNHTDEGVLVAVPHLAPNMRRRQIEAVQRDMFDRVLMKLGDSRPVLWYYTPMALGFTDHVKARAVVYDCMNELTLVHDAPPELTQRERLLFERADVVFTDGHSLCRHKRRTTRHRNVHPFVSCIDLAHFQLAREQDFVEPPDQAEIERPRVGFFGVIDERIDLRLLDELATARPDLQLVMIGPIVKSDHATLPQHPNVHWLGAKAREEIPAYLAGWDVAMLPFARNDATRFMSSTTPECLAAGKPVVATGIVDVVDPYGRAGLVWIADGAGELGDAIDEALASDRWARLAHADAFLDEHSWHRTWRQMWALVECAISGRTAGRTAVLRPPAGPSSVTWGRATQASASTEPPGAQQVNAKLP